MEFWNSILELNFFLIFFNFFKFFLEFFLKNFLIFSEIFLFKKKLHFKKLKKKLYPSLITYNTWGYLWS
jgi:hypothetical protein